jgi:hypothetical protein
VTSSIPDGGRVGRRRRWPWVVLGVVVIAVGAVVIARNVVFRDRSRVVTTGQALDRYRRSASTTTPATSIVPTTTVAVSVATTELPAPALPDPGVYRYRTTGDESIDVLGGAHHTYPAESTITVTPDGCGVRLRWDVLQERRDEWRLCPTPAGLAEAWTLQYHEFFKQPDPEELVCPADTLLLPIEPVAGAAWDAACTLANTPEPQHFEVVGHETVTVAGAPVAAIHLRQSVELGGDNFEHTTTDWWLAPTGLPLRSVQTKSSRSSSPIGPVTYSEQYTIELESLEPLK